MLVSGMELPNMTWLTAKYHVENCRAHHYTIIRQVDKRANKIIALLVQASKTSQQNEKKDMQHGSKPLPLDMVPQTLSMAATMS